MSIGTITKTEQTNKNVGRQQGGGGGGGEETIFPFQWPVC